MSRFSGFLLNRYLKSFSRNKELSPADAVEAQRATLAQLVHRAERTRIGLHYRFDQILKHHDVLQAFAASVPVHDYYRMRDEWWHRCAAGEPDVTWPGRTPYFSMSSGTSDATSKLLPVTHDLVDNVKTVGRRQLQSLAAFDLPPGVAAGEVLMLSSATTLHRRGPRREADMSGISMRHLPWWMKRLYVRPGPDITMLPQWKDRIQAIVRQAASWNIGTVCGVPSWTVLLFEELARHYRISSIHELWPNFGLYIHGGVAFDHYSVTFESFLERPVQRMETYMASEGSFGFQSRPNGGIRLVMDAGVFFEFIPYNDHTFDENGRLRDPAVPITIAGVRDGIDYAVVLTTCGGAWRYLIGDVVRFTDAARQEIRVTGRTQQFLNLCGEHLSVDNLNRAVQDATRKLGCTIGEFALCGFPSGGTVKHHWYVGTDHPVDATLLAAELDHSLAAHNDDYRVVRQGSLLGVSAETLPNTAFHDFLRARNHQSAMNKFPRVLRGRNLEAWRLFLVASGWNAETASAQKIR